MNIGRTYKVLVRNLALAMGVAVAATHGCRTPHPEAKTPSPAPLRPADLLDENDKPSAGTDAAAPNLVRSPKVVEARIARKAGKGRSKKPKNPEGIARERLLRRLDANGEIPPNALMAAKQAMEQMPEVQVEQGVLADAGIWSWQWLGPGNVGGRSRSVVIHPTATNVMLLGSVAGGIWRTTNGGASWSPINDFLPSLAVGTMVMDPGDPNVLYVGTGESFAGDGVPGAGIFKSTDGGLSWAQLPATAPTTTPTADPWGFVNRIAVSPQNGNIVLAATNSGIWRSTNAGTSWTQLTTQRTVDLKFRPGSGSDEAVAGLTDGTILFSTDLGASWALADFSGELFSTLVRSGSRADADGNADTLEVNSTAGFAVRDVIHVGLPGNLERATVQSVVDGDTLQVTDLQVDHPTGHMVRIPVSHNTTSLAAATTPDADNLADTVTVGSTAGIALGDALRIGPLTSTEFATVVSIVNGTTLQVTDLRLAHPRGADVATRRSGRMELAWGSGCTVYASANIGGGVIYKSTDCGETLDALSGTDDLPNYLCSNFLGIDDPNSCQGDYDNTIWVAPNDNDFIVVGGIDLWREPDTSNGMFLEKISNWLTYHLGLSAHADQHFIVHHPNYNGTTNKTVFVCNDGGIQVTNDIQSTFLGDLGWTNLANNLGITQFYGGAAAPDGSVIVGGAQDNDQLRYRPSDGSGAWYQAETGDGGYAAVNYNNPSIIYSEFVLLAIEKSTNGGDSYGSAINGLADAGASALFIAPFVMDPNNPAVLVAGGASIWRTTDHAANWSSIRAPLSNPPTAFCSAIDISRTVPNRIWVGYSDGTVSRTTTGVTTWTNVDNNGSTPPPNSFVTDIAINPNNASEVFVTFGGYMTGQVWFTDDDGQNWENRSGTGDSALPPVQVNTVRYHPADTNWVYVGTDLGVFASEDEGMIWSRTPRYGSVGHEGPANMEVSELFWQGGEYLIAATHGRGMYRTRPFSTVYVDQAYGGPEEGTLAQPFDTIAEGIGAAGHGTTISIQTGDYNNPGTTTFFKRGRVTARGGAVRIE